MRGHDTARLIGGHDIEVHDGLELAFDLRSSWRNA